MQQKRNLNNFHMRCLWDIYGVTWRDKIRNEVILQRTSCRTLFSDLKTSRLGWLGHVCRLSECRLPNNIFW